MNESITVTFHPDDKATYTYTLPDVVKMSDNLSQDLKEQASKYLWFSSLVSRLMAKRDHLSNILKTTVAKVELEYRRDAEGKNIKTTEAGIKALVEADKVVIACKNHLGDAESELGLSYSIRDAFAQRKDMLVALGANMRAELNSLTPDSIKG